MPIGPLLKDVTVQEEFYLIFENGTDILCCAKLSKLVGSNR
jgi:hypothetical protein